MKIKDYLKSGWRFNEMIKQRMQERIREKRKKLEKVKDCNKDS